MGINIGRPAAYDNENPADELAAYVVQNQHRISPSAFFF